MAHRIYIDTGGTFTDAALFSDEKVEYSKVETTPHDLTVGVLNSIEEVARRIGFAGAKAILPKTEAVVVSNTIAVNTFIQRAGAKVGLIVTKGFEDSAYGKDGNRLPDFLVRRNMILGIKGQIDAAGQEVEPVDKEEVARQVRELVARGARFTVISLANASVNASHERQAKKAIEEVYPAHYLGTIPFLLSTQVSMDRDDFVRTNAACINAYVHDATVRFLYKLEGELRDRGYPRALLVLHNSGSVSRIATAKAIDTFGSGPVGAALGVEVIGKLCEVPNLVSCDIGGTSADFAVAVGGKCKTNLLWELEGIPVGLPTLEVASMGAGGGTIAKLVNGKLQMGPESAGARPGPACYDLGGSEPTVTDACVVLGYVNPDYFLGGRRKLDAAKAKESIERKVAQPLGVKVTEAASDMVKETVSGLCGYAKGLMGEKGISDRDCAWLSVGGAGGIFAGMVAQNLGLTRCYMPPFASVFPPFGASYGDITHEFPMLFGLPLRAASGKYLSDFAAINQAIESLKGLSAVEFRAEGLPLDKVNLSLQLELKSRTPSFLARVPFDRTRFERAEEVEALCNDFAKLSTTKPTGEITLERLWLVASYPVIHPDIPTFPKAGKSPAAALKGKRKVFWEGDFTEAPIYELKNLQNGNEVTGLAIIEGEDTTMLVPKGLRYSVDEHHFGVLHP